MKKNLLKSLTRVFDRFRVIAVRTHDFIFHADEVSATAVMLALMSRGKWETPLPGRKGKKSISRVDCTEKDIQFQCDGHRLKVLRTRDEEACKEFQKEHEGYMYAVLDVGGKYEFEDEDIIRLDHHQADFELTQTIGEHEISYSSFGLTWGHLGMATLEAIYASQLCGQTAPETYSRLEDIHEIVRNRLVVFVDGVDSGTWPFPADRAYSYPHLISSLNPDDPSDAKASNEAFCKAVLIAYDNLMSVIEQSRKRVETQDILRAKLKETAGTRIMILDEHVHWQADLPKIDPEGRILYVVYPGNTDEWMVQAVPVEAGSFENRKPLPEEWAGHRDKILTQITGVEGAIFCHVGRFISGARSRKGARELAELAVSS